MPKDSLSSTSTQSSYSLPHELDAIFRSLYLAFDLGAPLPENCPCGCPCPLTKDQQVTLAYSALGPRLNQKQGYQCLDCSADELGFFCFIPGLAQLAEAELAYLENFVLLLLSNEQLDKLNACQCRSLNALLDWFVAHRQLEESLYEQIEVLRTILNQHLDSMCAHRGDL